jgi:molybdopterin molybdotransferase
VSELPGIDEALARVLERVDRLDPVEVALGDARGRVLARDAHAAVDLPPFDSSAMDGFAVRAEDTPGELRLSGESAAGAPSAGELEPGSAIEISTGGVVPEGADAVVPVERTQRTATHVTVERVEAGENVRPRGGDTAAGEIVAYAGDELRAPQLGGLAAAGIATVSCVRRPRVAILATGSELRRAGEPLGPGQIYESNTVLLGALVVSAGGDPTVLDAVADDGRATRDAIARGLDHDVLLTSGGVSVGPHDLVRGALRELGAEEVFWRVAVKPGKPIAFAVRGRTLVFGLPGNPVSSLVGFELFVRPALRALQGAAPGPQYRPGVLARTVRANDQRDELLRASARVEDGAVVLTPLGGQESHMIARAAAADALVLVPRGAGEVVAGEPVRWLPL